MPESVRVVPDSAPRVVALARVIAPCQALLPTVLRRTPSPEAPEPFKVSGIAPTVIPPSSLISERGLTVMLATTGAAEIVQMPAVPPLIPITALS